MGITQYTGGTCKFAILTGGMSWSFFDRLSFLSLSHELLFSGYGTMDSVSFLDSEEKEALQTNENDTSTCIYNECNS